MLEIELLDNSAWRIRGLATNLYFMLFREQNSLSFTSGGGHGDGKIPLLLLDSLFAHVPENLFPGYEVDAHEVKAISFFA